MSLTIAGSGAIRVLPAPRIDHDALGTSFAPTAAPQPLRPRVPALAEALVPSNVADLDLRLAEAGECLMRLAVRGTMPASYRGFWPDIVQAAAEAYGYTAEDLPVCPPAAASISAMDAVWAWVDLLPLEPGRPGSGLRWSTEGNARLRGIVISRAMVNPRTGRRLFSWRRLGRALSTNHETVRQMHKQALERILAELRLRRRVEAVAQFSGLFRAGPGRTQGAPYMNNRPSAKITLTL